MNPWNLTERELEVLEALIQHGRDKLVARVLGLSHKTVEVHMHNVRKKMGTNSRPLAILAYDRWKNQRATGYDFAALAMWVHA